jgi:hypothetical protein
MDKIDFKKTDKTLYSGPPGVFRLIEVPELPFLMIDGAGDPNSAPEYGAKVAALYALSYRLKFLSKAVHGRDYTVGPLEGLWWADDMADFTTGRRDRWKWTLMIRQPDWLTPGDIDTARAETIRKQAREADPKASEADLSAIRAERYGEGLSVQVLHLGPYADEAPTIARMHDVFMPENGLAPTGHHHEIYLSDPRRVAPEKLKTIVRQPVRRI